VAGAAGRREARNRPVGGLAEAPAGR
jgi:hypothetical protein